MMQKIYFIKHGKGKHTHTLAVTLKEQCDK